jgi:hypothetical protein
MGCSNGIRCAYRTVGTYSYPLSGAPRACRTADTKVLVRACVTGGAISYKDSSGSSGTVCACWTVGARPVVIEAPRACWTVGALCCTSRCTWRKSTGKTCVAYQSIGTNPLPRGASPRRQPSPNRQTVLRENERDYNEDMVDFHRQMNRDGLVAATLNTKNIYPRNLVLSRYLFE